MTPTHARFLVGLGLAAAVVVWALTRVWATADPSLLDVPWPAAVLLALLAVAIFIAAGTLRGRLRGDPGRQPVPPLGAARFAVLGKTASHAGALLAGGYAGFGLYVLPELTSGVRSDRVIGAAATTVAALLLVAAGIVLERVCRLPPPRPGAPTTRSGDGTDVGSADQGP